MATPIRIPNNWEPRDYQRELWCALERGVKRAIGIWHRRAGKDDVCLHRAAVAAHERIGGYWHMLPLQTQARRAIWDAVNPHTGKRRIDEAFHRDLIATKREAEMLIKFKNGSTWQVIGSDNYNALVGAPPAGVIFSEWALADPNSWAYIRPILDENDGWAAFITTPRGNNHCKRMLDSARKNEKWFSQVLSAHDTNVFSSEKLMEVEQEYKDEFGIDFGRSMFHQEYLCSFDAAILGAYYTGELAEMRKEGRLCRVHYDKRHPVHTAWDLGIGDTTVIIFFQEVGLERRIIDFYEASGMALDHYAKELAGKGYVYGTHFLPHDADSRELGTGLSRKEVLEDLLPSEIEVLPRLAVDDGIQAARTMFNRLYIDETKCERLVNALSNYRRKWDEKNKVFMLRPLHDWASNPADSFRYMAVAEPVDRAMHGGALNYSNNGIY
ncbi:hypothetical protein [Kiloniella antarctica]|uniref:Terminase n=1 Tax=Kiloniella antarctica TaxID=1550907 RepID=A0ABW5BNY0_9PROT